MKYLLIFFYFGQICVPAIQGSGLEGSPYFYMRSFENYEEAREEQIKFEISGDGQGTIVYGYPSFGKMRKRELMLLEKRGEE